MFGIGLDSIKLYGLIALGVIVSGFLIVFKMRGMKIDALEKVVEEKKAEIVTRIKEKKQNKAASKASQGIADTVIQGEKEKTSAGTAVDKMMEDSMDKDVPSGL